MSYYQTQFGSTSFNTAADAELLLRLGIALAARHRAAWRVVRVAAQNGIVRLEGIVPTFYDRQLILAVAQHVAGVLRVEDELAIDESAAQQIAPAVSYSEPETVHLVHGGTEVQSPARRNEFQHLPVLDESLEDILSELGHQSPSEV
jgi:hypothetical protein